MLVRENGPHLTIRKEKSPSLNRENTKNDTLKKPNHRTMFMCCFRTAPMTLGRWSSKGKDGCFSRWGGNTRYLGLFLNAGSHKQRVEASRFACKVKGSDGDTPALQCKPRASLTWSFLRRSHQGRRSSSSQQQQQRRSPLNEMSDRIGGRGDGGWS